MSAEDSYTTNTELEVRWAMNMASFKLYTLANGAPESLLLDVKNGHADLVGNIRT